MDLLILTGYDSQSSTSTSSSHKLTTNQKEDDTIHTCYEQNALSINTTNHTCSAGCDCHSSSGKDCNDEQRIICNSRGRNNGTIQYKGENIEQSAAYNCKVTHDSIMPVIKRRKVCDKRSYKVMIDNNTNDTMFERSHPHWEGRWTGHLHLPFPSLESLDDDNVVEGETDANNINEDECSCSDSSEEDDDEDDMPQSRMFVPTARRLIHHWASLLEEDCAASADERTNSNCDDKESISPIVIVPQIPMDHPIDTNNDTSLESKQPAASDTPSSTTTKASLHISLARPIYLPAPSVDPFIADIDKSIRTVVTKRNSTNQQSGRILHLQPQHAKIFTNDEQTRSFLSIPVSAHSSRWIKQSLLPPIDATMLRFGLQTYYNTEEEGEGGCILHVSVASMKGNVIPQMLCRRVGDSNETNGRRTDDDRSMTRGIRCIPLLSADDKTGIKLIEEIPSCIPIRIQHIKCEFGKATKQLAIPL